LFPIPLQDEPSANDVTAPGNGCIKKFSEFQILVTWSMIGIILARPNQLNDPALVVLSNVRTNMTSEKMRM